MPRDDRGNVPGWCLRLVRAFVPRRLSHEALLGDLLDEHAEILGARGRIRADAWLRATVLAIAARYAWSRLVGGSGLPHASSPSDPHERQSVMTSLIQDIGYGIRSLRSNPGSTLVVVVILAVGIGANVATFSLVEAALLRSLPFAEADRLVWAATTFAGNPNPAGSAQDWADYRERSDSFESLAALTAFDFPATVVAGNEPSRVSQSYVSTELFATLGVDPARGRGFEAAEGEPGSANVVIVSDRLWRAQLGARADVVGMSIRVDGEAHTVVGVMPTGFHFLIDADVWRPLRIGGPFARARRFHNWLMIGRLGAGIELHRAQSEVDAISDALQQEYPDSNQDKALQLTPLADALGSFVGTQLLLLMATAGVVLLVAGSNVAGLLLARGSTRQSELAIRAVLGASRGRIVRQLITESLVLGATAGVVGLLLAIGMRRVLLRVVPLSLLGIEELGTSPLAVAFGLAATVGISLLFGTAPALRAVPDRPSEELRGGRSSTGSRSRLRSALVAAQVALAVVLLIGAALLVRSFVRLSSQDPGFDTTRLLSAEIDLAGTAHKSPEEYGVFFEQLAERLAATPGIENVAIANQLPIRNPGNNIAIWDADAPAQSGARRPLAYQRSVLPGYFEAMAIPLVAGRGIGTGDRAGEAPVFVLSRSLAERLFPRQSAVGRRVAVDWGSDTQGLVVGVVDEVRISGLAEAEAPTFYSAYAQRPLRTMNLALRTSGDPAGVVDSLRAAVRELDPSAPIGDIRTIDELISDSVGEPKLISLAMSAFSSLALALSLVGLYGVLSQSVAQRRREIGLRLALGATHRDVVLSVLRSGMLLVGVGLALGVPTALAASRLLQGLLFQLSPADPATFALVVTLLSLVGSIACLLPALRAVGVDPAVALRSE